MKTIIQVLCFGIILHLTYQLEPNKIIIVVLSQENIYHLKLAENLKQDVILQAKSIDKEPPIIHFSHLDFPHVGGWTILPLIPKIAILYQHEAAWIFFCEEVTRFKLHNLLDTLGKYDHTKEIWLGHGLHDREATIIHHFAFFNNPQSFLYPNLASGFAVSIPLLKSLVHRIHSLYDSEIEFSIDASHELALFIWNKGNGVSLVNESTFCIKHHPHCASYVAPFTACADSVKNDNILFAVKTCEKYHKERIPIIKNTWAKYVNHIHFYSEVDDESIPTINLKIPNTERGHCRKTLAILHHVSYELQQNSSIRWIVITDDDTLISSARLQHFLSCYNSSNNIALGERYGFKVYTTQGYNYITGGGGMVFSAPLVKLLTTSGVCECPSDQSPDDMFLGVCLARLGINITHSSSFHQARPPDYDPDYLASQEVVSFHKYWMINPVNVYKQWFSDADIEMSAGTINTIKHTEL